MFFAPKMRIFTVHKKEDADFPLEKTIFVREGFSFMAFLFSFAWMLYHKMWFHAMLVFGVVLILSAFEENHLINKNSLAILQVALSFIVGFHANDWRRNHLASKGYIAGDVVVSDNDIRARQRYFDRVLSA